MFPILVSAKENDLKGYNVGGNRKTKLFWIIIAYREPIPLLEILILYKSPYQPISCHWSLSIPPENIRKPELFWWLKKV